MKKLMLICLVLSSTSSFAATLVAGEIAATTTTTTRTVSSTTVVASPTYTIVNIDGTESTLTSATANTAQTLGLGTTLPPSVY